MTHGCALPLLLCYPGELLIKGSDDMPQTRALHLRYRRHRGSLGYLVCPRAPSPHTCSDTFVVRGRHQVSPCRSEHRQTLVFRDLFWPAIAYALNTPAGLRGPATSLCGRVLGKGARGVPFDQLKMINPSRIPFFTLQESLREREKDEKI